MREKLVKNTCFSRIFHHKRHSANGVEADSYTCQGVTVAAKNFVAARARLLPVEVPGRSRAGPGWPVGRLRWDIGSFGQAWSAERGGEQGARTADLGRGGPEFTAFGVPRETFWPGDLAFSPAGAHRRPQDPT